MKRYSYLVCLLFFSLLFSISIDSFSQNKTWFVKVGGSGSGTTWSTAIGNLQTAINNANSTDTILVSQGSYYGGFTMKDGVQVYGGFSGTEQYSTQSLPTKNITILDGSNLYRVVTQVSDFTAPTVWSGFVIQNGRVEDLKPQSDINIGTIIYGKGTNKPAGVVFKYDKTSGSGLMLALEQRTLEWGGNGIDIEKLENIEDRNLALLDFNGAQNTTYINEQLGINNDYAATWCHKYEGGGFTDWYLPACGELNVIISDTYTIINDILRTIDGASLLSGDNSYFTSTEKSPTNVWAQSVFGINDFSNVAQLLVLPIRAFNISSGDVTTDNSGGGALLQQNGILRNCIIRNNKATLQGGGVYVGKGASVQGCWITENSAAKSTGVYNWGAILNCTVTNNQQDSNLGSFSVGAILTEPNSFVSNSITFGNTDITNNVANIVSGGTVNYTASNIVVTGVNNKIVTSADFAGAGDFHLLTNSALAKAGDTFIIPSDYKTDLDGSPRIINNTIALGAYQNLELLDIIITMNDTTVVYNGLPHSLKVEVQPNTLTPVITYKDASGIETTTPPTKAGVYTVTALITAQDPYPETIKTATLTIQQAIPTVTLQPKTAFYSGESIGIDPVVAAGPVGAEDLLITYHYTSSGGYNSEQAPTNVGVYSVVAKTVATDDFMSVTSSPVSLTIQKVTPEILATSKTTEYTGEAIPIDAAQVTGSTTAHSLPLTYSYAGVGSTIYGPLSTPPSQSGSYQVTVSTVGDSNHTSASAIVSLTIGKGMSTITLTGGEYIYDGSSKTLTAYVSPSALTVSYTYEGRLSDGTIYPASSLPPVNAGLYMVTARTPGDLSHLPSQASAELVIHKKASRIDMVSQTVQYTGSPISIPTPVTDPVNAVLVISYKGINGTIYVESASAPTNVGEYLVRAIYDGDVNHLSSTVTSHLTISSGRAPSLYLKNKTVTYTGAQQSIDPAIVEPSQAASELTVRYLYSNQYYPLSSVSPRDAGIYTVRAATIGTSNYDPAYATAYFTIQKARQSITFDQSQLNGHYFGESPFRLISSSNSGLPITFESGNPSIASVSDDGTVTIHKGGTVTITAHQVGDKNHYAAESVTRTLNIAGAIPTVTLQPKTAVYSGEAIGIDPVVAAGPVGAEDLLITYHYTSSGGYNSEQAPTNVGVYSVVAKTVATDDFMSVSSSPVSLTIQKVTPEILATSKSAEYTGEPISIDAAQVTGSTTAHTLPLTYSYAGVGSTVYGPLSAPPSQSGSYQVTVSMVGDSNHTSASAIVSLTIGKGISTITLTGAEYTYDGTSKTLTAYVSPSALTVSYTYEGRLSDGTIYPASSLPPVNTGLYMVTARTPGDLSHLPSEASAELVIHKKSSSIDMVSQTVQYTGSPISIPTPVTDPSNALLVISYRGINGTNYVESTSAPVNIGEYLVRASYAGDVNHLAMTTTSELTITTGNSPSLYLKNKTVTYTGAQQSIDPAIVEPSQAASELTVRYLYSNQYYPLSSVSPRDAGIYTVRAATIGTSNYDPAYATAYFTIQKARQSITFDQSQLNGHYFGESPFRLISSSDSGLPITFESGNPSIASVSDDGTVTIHKGGTVTITAHQVGDKNHYAAESVTRTLNIAGAIPTVTLQPKTAVYSGEAIGIDPVVAAGPVGAEDLLITYHYTSSGGYNSEQAPTNVGVYSVVAKTVATDDFMSVSSSPVSLTIQKGTPEILATSKSAEYTGEPISIDAAQVTGSTTAHTLPLTYSYAGVGSTIYGPLSTPPSQSGSYQVTVSTVGDSNHTSASAIVSLTIGKGVSTITLTGGEYIYDGSSKTLTAYVSPSALTVSYTYEGRLSDGTIYPASSLPPVNAGLYMVTARTPGDLSHLPSEASAELVIHKKASRIDMVSQTVQYTGNAISIPTPVTDPSNALLVISYRGINGTNYVESTSPPVNIGEYFVRASYAGDVNHLATTATSELTITTGNSPRLILKSKTVTYTGAQQSIDPAIVEPSQAASELTVRYLYSNQYYPLSSVSPRDAGIYTVRAATIGSSNYDPAYATAYFTIQKARQTITFEQGQLNGHYFGESPFQLTAISESSLPITFESGNPSIASVSDDGTVTIHKGGTVTITAHQVGDKNHYAAESVTRTLNIAGAIPTVTLQPKTAVYSGEAIGIDPVVAAGPVGAEDLLITYHYTSSGGYNSEQAPTNVGVYNVVAKTVATGSFQSVTSSPVSLMIQKVTPEILATSKSAEYTGEPISIDAAQVTGSTTAHTLALTYRYAGTGSTVYGPVSSPPTESGSYRVTISTVGDTNHTSASAIVSLTIGKGISTITLTGGEYTYDGTSKTLSAYVSPSTLSVSYTYEGRLSDGTIYPSSSIPPINAGLYMVTAHTPGDLSHLPSQASAELVIHKKASVINLVSESVQYTGSPISISRPVTDPVNAVLVISYKGINGTIYVESASAPTNVGEYLVRAIYDGDVNHLSSTVTSHLTISSGRAPSLYLKNKTVTYTGAQQSIDPAIIEPSDAASQLLVRYMYSNQYYPMSSLSPRDAGIYTVRATTIGTSNYDPAYATAYFTIQKARQSITFDQSQLNGHYFGEAPFRLISSSDSGLPITFESGNPGIASVSDDGMVTIHKGGTVTITAHQVGDKNHYAAESVTRTLNIISTDATLVGLTINGVDHNTLEPYIVPCSYPSDEIDVAIITDPNAIVNIEKEFSVDVTKPMIKKIEFSITSQDNSQTRYYTLTVEKNFKFYDVVIQRWNNTLSVINNPANNGGYKFTDYKWFKNGVQVGSNIYYSAGENGEQLNEYDAYYAELTTDKGIVMRTCEGFPVLKSLNIKAYPNPLTRGTPLYIEVDFDEELIRKSELRVYDIAGRYISSVKIEDRLTPVELPQKSGTYIIKLVSKDGFEKSLKVIVK